MSTDTNAQEIYKAHIEFGEKHPEWMQQALEVVNQWGRAEATLTHAVADALLEAYKAGQRGEYPQYVPPTPRVLRRMPPAPVAVKPTVIRRIR